MEVSFDVAFTPWKWTITAIFGLLPLLINISIFMALFLVIPAWTYLMAQKDRYAATSIKYEEIVSPDDKSIISTQE
jgi:hypothetical protein